MAWYRPARMQEHAHARMHADADTHTAHTYTSHALHTLHTCLYTRSHGRAHTPASLNKAQFVIQPARDPVVL